MADEGLKKQNQYGFLFDTKGNFSHEDVTNEMGESISAFNMALDNWKKIQQEAANYYNLQNASAEAYAELMDDERSKAKAWQDHEKEYFKFKLSIEKEIADLREKGNEAEAEALEKQLETAKAIRKTREDQVKETKKKTDKTKKQTNFLKTAYGDTIDAAEEAERAKKEQNEFRDKLIKQGLMTGDKEMIKAGLTGGKEGAAGIGAAVGKMVSAIAGFAKQIDGTVQEIAKYKSDWDTRLFGTTTNHWTLTTAIQHALGTSPYVRQTEILKNIDKAVDAGIAYNIEQRAFLETVKDDIAGTFDAFDSTLLQIIRIQQSDSTAARLGMEARLNSYFNSMYKNTEYLSNVSDSVTSALYEATSLLSAKESIGFEFQAQKWLGSLYSVGMSNQGVQSIAEALGQLASGDVSGTNSGAGKLLVMAASRSGLDYSEMLTDGLDSSEMNSLMKSMVEYLKTISSSNKVVQSQLANVFGLRTSDIESIRNLSTTDIKNITNQNLDYSGALANLYAMTATIGSRISTGEMMTNVIDNFKTTLATGIGNNPALYAMWTASNMLDELVGGIPIPSIGAWTVGNGVQIDLETTVADLMRVGALGGSLLSGVGAMASGLLTNSAGLAGALGAFQMFSQDQLRKKDAKGGGLDLLITNPENRLTTTDFTTGQISIVGNASGSGVQEAIMSQAEDQKAELANGAMQQTEEEEKDIKLMDVNETLVKILDLWNKVIEGDSLNVKNENAGIIPSLTAGL